MDKSILSRLTNKLQATGYRLSAVSYRLLTYRAISLSLAAFTFTYGFSALFNNPVVAQEQINPSTNLTESTEKGLLTFGPSELENPEYYEAATLEESELISQSSENIIEEVFEEQEEVISFFLETNADDEFVNDAVEVVFQDDSSTGFLKIHVNDAYFSESRDEVIESTQKVSQLFNFNKNIKVVRVKSSNDVKIKTLSPESTANSNIDISTSSAETNAKNSFFQSLGLNVSLREEWGAPSSSGWDPYRVPIDRIIVHHTATSVNTSNPAQAVLDIYNYHKNLCANNSGSYNPSNPDCDEPDELWQDIGYNYLIDQNGQIYEGRAGGNGSIGAHSPPNWGTIGIGVIGNYDPQLPTNSAMDSLSKLIGRLSKFNDLEVTWQSTIYGHRDRQATSCQGETLYNTMSPILSTANIYKNSNVGLNNIVSKVDSLVEGRTDVIKSNGEFAAILDQSSVSTTVRDKILNSNSGVTIGNTVKDITFLKVDENYIRKFLKEGFAFDSNAILQPEYFYEIAWDNSSPTRSIPADYDTNTHWNYEKIKLPEAWKDLGGCTSDNSCQGSSDVTVAIIDTGVAYEDANYDAGGSYTLESFGGFNIEIPGSTTANGTYNEGYDRQYFESAELTNVTFTTDTAPDTAYDAGQEFLCNYRSSFGDPGDECTGVEITKINRAWDDNGHGTFVANQIAGNTDDADPNEVVGIASNVSIMPIKGFLPNDSSMCYESDFVTNDPDCLDDDYSYKSKASTSMLIWSIDHAVANNADVINMSLSGAKSGGSSDIALQNSIDDAYNSGVIIVAASGNNNSNADNYLPGGMDNVITVGATNQNDTKASYSNFGSTLDIVAPVGGSPTASSLTFSCFSADICWKEDSGTLFNSFTSNSSPYTAQGTSFAAPQVTAAAALLLTRKPSATPYAVEYSLEESAIDLGTSGFDNSFGHGQLNIEAALAEIDSAPADPPDDPDPVPFFKSVYRFFNTITNGHFYTASESEKDKIVRDFPQYVLEGVAFRVLRDDISVDTKPVFRFYNSSTGAHFYTASSRERDKVIDTLPEYTYEGVAYYIYKNEGVGRRPLFRFYNYSNGIHFYTKSVSERDKIIDNFSNFAYEGIVYYVD